MLMSELSRKSGVPIATIKYYLREGLLAPGEARGATRAEYGQAHLRRLRLIRALLEIGELPVAAIRRVLTAVDDETITAHELLGTVQYALGPHVTPDPGDRDWQAALRDVDDLIGGLGWNVSLGSPARALLAGALVALQRTESAPLGPGLDVYAEAMGRLAELEVAAIPPSGAPRERVARRREDGRSHDPEDHPSPAAERTAMTESAVAGMVLYERVLIALRRLAQEDASSRRFAVSGTARGGFGTAAPGSSRT